MKPEKQTIIDGELIGYKSSVIKRYSMGKNSSWSEVPWTIRKKDFK
jgi:hypothetical protein